MRYLHVDNPGDDRGFDNASVLARQTARNNRMQDPTIMAWHKTGDRDTPACYEGADPDIWWLKYGIGNGGVLEVFVGDDYQFILMDARGYEKTGALPLRNLTDVQGNEYLCFAPLLDRGPDTPTLVACTRLDGWAADQY